MHARLSCLLVALSLLATHARAAVEPNERPVMPGGELKILGKPGVTGACPLKHTDVRADVAGFIARVTVKQSFQNSSADKIEAVYVFPLPDDSAVDRMVMTVGDRKIVGQVKRREEARKIYDDAVAQGHVASLLDQERPNIFTQSVANIEPGAAVEIEIAYTQTLKYQDGLFEFSFPMVVGPRYIPGQPSGSSGTGTAPDTDQVPDASRISPPVTPKGTRTGHDISFSLRLDAGMPIRTYESPTHAIDATVTRSGPDPEHAGEKNPKVAYAIDVKLKNEATIPNKDFVFRYGTAGAAVQDALLTHKDERGSFFTLILQPPKKVERKAAVGRELIFVLDTSGSMGGFPITKARLCMGRAIDSLGPQDTFNLITFAGDTHVLWDKPRPNTAENRELAQAFLSTREGSGGTEMMKAIEAALVRTAPPAKADPAQPDPIRVVCFMTDGYVGNDMAIIDAVKKNAGITRVFSFGIGSSVNRFLLDGMAYAGRGEVEYVLMETRGDESAERFYKRVDAPVLTDISVDWGNLPVADVYPKQIPDLFSAKPVILHGRLKGEVKPGTTIKLRGNNANGAFERAVNVQVAEANDTSKAAMASLWARAKAGDLMMQDLAALQSGTFPEPLKNELTSLGTEFGLMTQFTSFVAVEELTVTKGGKPTTVAVPVEMPEGVSYEGIFADRPGQQGGRGVLGLSLSSSGPSGPGGGGYGGAAPAFSLAGAATPAPSVTAAPAPRPAARQMAAQNQPANGDPAKPRESLKKAELASDPDVSHLEPATPADPLAKLDPALKGLAARVEKDGADGNLNADGFVVVQHRVDVMIYLADTSPQTLKALEALGFAKTGESKAVRLLIGTIDVRKLEELAKLKAVTQVSPVK
jgi:Ca-activated chloride channel family protein